MTSLDARLENALEKGEARALVALYEEAAAATGEAAQQAFFLTHAYVHALECGAARAQALRLRLIEMGCETP